MESRPIFLLAALALAGCGGKAVERPFFTEPPLVLLASGERAAERAVAVCYSSATTTAADLQTMVAAACREPRLLRQDRTGNCTLLQPVRATFACAAIDPALARIETPYRRATDTNRFRSEPQVPAKETTELKP